MEYLVSKGILMKINSIVFLVSSCLVLCLLCYQAGWDNGMAAGEKKCVPPTGAKLQSSVIKDGVLKCEYIKAEYGRMR